MKQIKKNYLAEVIFEIRFPAELSIESQKDRYYERIRKHFPQILIPKTATSEAYGLEPYKFASKEWNRFIAFSINKFFYISNEYQNFQIFRQELQDCLIPFLKLHSQISTLKKVSLKYTNRFPISRKAELIPLEDYLNYEYKLPDGIPNQFTSFFSDFTSKTKDGNLRMHVQYENEKEELVLGLEFFFDNQLIVSQIPEYTNNAHEYIKKAFFSLLKNQPEDTYKEI
ncbi:MAG: TIGR04255 family protein [Candidatus Omnitrophica bacterium]|nr:TIGR04255 family protein [Candidatus Omnitrophota bacterium]